MDRELLMKKSGLLGLIDKTYQVEALYKKGEPQQGAFILESLREGLQELNDELGKQNSV
ncbi:hypothetical protein ACD661_15240 [Legionella lytica]|uniref:Uncharacterized protein n=1 Tax=Legionella lytica TaxID=96232 RepID=A0ABW8DB21_9GAMM